MSISCKHGRLARQCNECRQEGEIAELQAEVERLREELERAHKADPTTW